jgi:D-glycero-beta-D-manno-heptose 1-phosphate adenylyltransferase
LSEDAWNRLDGDAPEVGATAVSTQKIFEDPARLALRIDEARRLGRTIVFANGCFELLHVGHVRYLQAARELGDLLIVAVNTDRSLGLIKPDRRPVNADRERMEIIAALGSVDYVVPLSDRTPSNLIALFRPHIHTKGTDYTLDQIPERVIVESYGGRVELVGGPKERSTTAMLRTIKGSGADTGRVDPPVPHLELVAPVV